MKPKKKRKAITGPPPLSTLEVGRALGIKQFELFERIRSGEVETVRIDHEIRIPVREADRLYREAAKEALA
jgi:hypothetical protein